MLVGDSMLSQTVALSAGLAGAVHQHTVSTVRESYRSLSDRGVERGPFYVLYLSSMPSVLMEVGFLTHEEETALRARTELMGSRVFSSAYESGGTDDLRAELRPDWAVLTAAAAACRGEPVPADSDIPPGLLGDLEDQLERDRPEAEAFYAAIA